jgi:small-conductance mechanosensitive channel
VQSLTPSAPASPSGKGAPATASSDDLEVAKAQLGLDTDELADAQRDLDRAVGDDSSQIQEELTAREVAMQRLERSSRQKGEIAALSVRQHSTLAGRIGAWFKQTDRYDLLQQAQQQTQQDITAFTAQHNTLEAQLNAPAHAPAATADHGTRLAALKDRSTERQILSIYDDRIQTEQQLAAVYAKWSAQVRLQHNVVFQLILQSCAVILLIVIGMLLCDTLVRQLLARPGLDRRQTQTLRSILQLGVQVLGVVLILLVIFGVPKETPTILGLTTAALTVALQDFILAFLGWFVLVGKHGMHVGDWVEINGVGGEVTEVGLFSTSLLETGRLEDKGHPTGRRISFMNSFAIRGTYFNFSTSGQWMWDEISVTIPSSEDTGEIVEKIHAAVLQETEENAQLAEQEWKRSAHGVDLTRFSAEPVVNLRPSSSGIGAQIRYVTRASQRFELSNRIYQRVIEVLRGAGGPTKTDEKHAVTAG